MELGWTATIQELDASKETAKKKKRKGYVAPRGEDCHSLNSLLRGSPSKLSETQDS